MSNKAKTLMLFTLLALAALAAVYFYRKNKTSEPALTSGTGASNAPAAPPADSAARYIRVTSY
ncbi:MAG TPA: hypothetical protein PKM40_03935 [Bacteroidia bacterium]|nr:hypothetical protein [Bacteroidia bacterium]